MNVVLIVGALFFYIRSNGILYFTARAIDTIVMNLVLKWRKFALVPNLMLLQLLYLFH